MRSMGSRDHYPVPYRKPRKQVQLSIAIYAGIEEVVKGVHAADMLRVHSVLHHNTYAVTEISVGGNNFGLNLCI